MVIEKLFHKYIEKNKVQRWYIITSERVYKMAFSSKKVRYLEAFTETVEEIKPHGKRMCYIIQLLQQ